MAFALVEIATGAEVKRLHRLPITVTLPNGDVCDFDKVGQVAPDAAAPLWQVYELAEEGGE